MKNRITAAIALLTVLIISTSCVASSQLSVANSASITRVNFRRVKTVDREYKAVYFLGIGGFNKAEDLQTAIEEMTLELKPNQALAYINVVESSMVPIIPLVFTRTTYVSATVIEYTD